MLTNKLTDTAIRKAKYGEKSVKLSDGGGLYLELHPNGSRYWRMKYRHAGSEKRLAFGVYPEVTLAEARRCRDDARKLIANGTDPGELRKATKATDEAKAEAARMVSAGLPGPGTFEHVAREWLTTIHFLFPSTSMSTAAAPDLAIRLAKVNKYFRSFQVLRDIDLEVATGERVVVCGPSGSGKSTMIRCVNALEPHSDGEIVVDGVVLQHGDNRSLLKVRRDVGMVFQSFNLFPHLSVLQNCMLAPMHVLGVDPKDGMTMVCVTHEMNFARQVADSVVFMDQGQIVEVGTPAELFGSPKHERTKRFLQQVIH